MRLRVEELAERAEVSVDTIRFYQKRRLVPAPQREGRLAWYTSEHLERIERIRQLQAEGFTLGVIQRFLEGTLDPSDEPLAAAVAGHVHPEGVDHLLSLAQLADRVGVPEALLETVVGEGLLVARRHDGDTRFSSADVPLLQAGLQLLQAGLPLPELLALARRYDTETRGVAEEAVRLFDTHIRKALRAADLSAEEKGQRLVEAFRTTLPAVTTLVAFHFRRVLLEVAQQHLELAGDPGKVDGAGADAPPRLEAMPVR